MPGFNEGEVVDSASRGNVDFQSGVDVLSDSIRSDNEVVAARFDSLLIVRLVLSKNMDLVSGSSAGDLNQVALAASSDDEALHQTIRAALVVRMTVTNVRSLSRRRRLVFMVRPGSASLV